MQCERCKKREATIHMTMKTHNGKKDLFLCKLCAREMFQYDLNTDNSSNVNNLLQGFIVPKGVENEANQCKKCGSSLQSILKTGLFGCSECYDTFGNDVKKIIGRVQHLKEEHVGKVPTRYQQYIKVEKQIEQLEKELAELVEKQNFEEAAIVRDKINALKGDGNDGADEPMD